jgi:integrase
MPVFKDQCAKKNPWWYEFNVGKDALGKRIRIRKKGFRTQRDAQKALSEAQDQYNKGTYVEPSKLRYGEYLTEVWLNNKSDLGKQTLQNYHSFINTHITPSIGSYPIAKLNPLIIQNLITELKKKGLADGTVKRIYSIIHTSLAVAEKMQIIQKNVAALIDKPKVGRRELKVWDVPDVKKFIEETKEKSRYSIIFLLAVYTGMRQGELLGLRWSDIDFEKGVLRIQQTLSHDGKELRAHAKTKTSIRSLAISPETISALKKQRKMILQEKMFLGNEYRNYDLVVCTSLGTPVIPRHINKVWFHFLSKVMVPKITFHDLRHTHASLLLKQGIHPKIVSERLGHSSIQMTLDTYTHLLPNMQEAAAAGLDQMLK